MHKVRVFRVVGGEEVQYEGVDASSGESTTGTERVVTTPGDVLGVGPGQRRSAARMAMDETPSELRRKLAWAVGSFYQVEYTSFRTWPAEYARLAASRLVEIHGLP